MAGHLLLRVRRAARPQRLRHHAELKLAVVLLVVAAVSAAAVLGTRANSPSPGAPTRSEVAWIDAWGKWSGRLQQDTAVADSLVLAPAAQFLASTRPLEECSGFARVPEPPLGYASAYRQSRSVCDVVETMPRLARRLVKGDGQASADFSLAYDRANLMMTEAEETLRVSLSSHRRLPTRTGHTTSSRIEPRLSRIATALAGRRTEARCWSPADWDAVVGELHAFYGERRDHDLAGFAEPAVSRDGQIHLAPDVCAALSANAPEERVLSFAVDVLAHESEHIFSPTGTEAETECASVQHIPRTAALLGLPAKQGRELADSYWHVYYPRDTERYRTVRCSEGGPLDETPGDGIWP